LHCDHSIDVCLTHQLSFQLSIADLEMDELHALLDAGKQRARGLITDRFFSEATKAIFAKNKEGVLTTIVVASNESRETSWLYYESPDAKPTRLSFEPISNDMEAKRLIARHLHDVGPYPGLGVDTHVREGIVVVLLDDRLSALLSTMDRTLTAHEVTILRDLR